MTKSTTSLHANAVMEAKSVWDDLVLRRAAGEDVKESDLEVAHLRIPQLS